MNLVVRDMAASAVFYRSPGFDVEAPAPEWAPHHRRVGVQQGMDVDLDSEAFVLR